MEITGLIISFFLSFFFGASIGSFINVVLDRYNTGLSIWKRNSFCFSCNQSLRRLDMFPIISFLLLKGKCRNCNNRISISTFFIELCMGILSVFAAIKLGLVSLELGAWSLETIFIYIILVAIFAVIVLISFYDLRHMIIPDYFLISLFILSFVYNSLPIIFSNALSFKLLALSLLNNTISGVVLSLPFFMLFLFSKGRLMGFGDIKYMFVIGCMLGFTLGASAIILSFWVGAAFSILLLTIPKVLSTFGLYNLKNKFKMNSAIPFGPFLSLGVIISFYINVDILKVQILKELLSSIF